MNKKLLKYLMWGVVTIFTCVFVRCESGNIIKVKKGTNVASTPVYVIKWGFGLYIKDYHSEYFDYKTDHCGTSASMTDNYTVVLNTIGSQVKLKVKTTYWLESDIEAVIKFKLDHKGMKENFYQKQLDELLQNYPLNSQNDLQHAKNGVETGLNNLWQDVLPMLKFQVIELMVEKI